MRSVEGALHGSRQYTRKGGKAAAPPQNTDPREERRGGRRGGAAAGAVAHAGDGGGGGGGRGAAHRGSIGPMGDHVGREWRSYKAQSDGLSDGLGDQWSSIRRKRLDEDAAAKTSIYSDFQMKTPDSGPLRKTL